MAKKFYIKAQGNTATIRLVGNISADKNSAEQFTQELDNLRQAGVTNLIFFIRSGGGDVFEANEIYDRIKTFPGSKICYLGSMCASAATVCSLGFDKVYISPLGFYMIHNLTGGLYGGVKDFQSYLNLLTQLTDKYVGLYSKKTGIPEAEIRVLMDAETWMSAEIAKEKGFVDEILEYPEIADTDLEINQEEDIYEEIENFGYKNLPASIKNSIPKNNQKTDFMKHKLILMLAAAGIMLSQDSSDAQVEAAYKALIDENAKLKNDLDNEKKSIAKAKAKILVDNHISLKRGTEGERDDLMKDAEANPEMFERMSAKMATPSNATNTLGKTETLNENGIANDRAAWTFDDWKEKDAKGLQNMKDANVKAFNELFKAKFGSYPA